MKRIAFCLLLVFLALVPKRALAGDHSYAFQLKSVEAPTLLGIYSALFDVRLVVSSTVSNLEASLTTLAVETAERAKALNLIEKAAVEQAGIVFTHLSDGRVSVTYNELLSVRGPDPSFRPLSLLTTSSPPSYVPIPPKPSQQRPPDKRVPYSFELRSANVPILLDVFHEFFGVRLVVSSIVSNLSARVTTPAEEPVSRVQARKLIEEAGLEQAGVVFTDLADGRVSVTYNELLSKKGRDAGFFPQLPRRWGRRPPYSPTSQELPPQKIPNKLPE